MSANNFKSKDAWLVLFIVFVIFGCLFAIGVFIALMTRNALPFMGSTVFSMVCFFLAGQCVKELD
jgi:uncharacterized membrane protein